MSIFYNGTVAITERYYDTRRATFNADGDTLIRSYKFREINQVEIDEDDVVAGLVAATPLTIGNLVRRNVEARQIQPHIWFADVTWETFRPTKNDQPGYEEVIRGSTSGATTRLRQAINHVRSYDKDGVINDPAKIHDGALNVERTSSGMKYGEIDVSSRQLEFSIEYAFAPGTIDFTYINTLYQLTATVNDSSFRGLEAGEVLFLGAEFDLSNVNDEKLTYNFAASPNVSNFKIGAINGTGGISITKKGWEYLWTEHAINPKVAADATKQMKAKLLAAHVEQVYYEGDFSLFGI